MKNTTPEKMNLIINIQMMQEKAGSFFQDTFQELNENDIDTLRMIQDETIIIYNKSLK